MAHDPAEHQNLIPAKAADVRALRAELGTVLDAHPRRPASDSQAAGATPQSERLLTSLGYLAPGPRSRAPGSNADPKDRLSEFKLYEKGMLHFANGRPAEAAVLLNQVLAQDPTNTLARRDLGAVYLDLQDYEKARLFCESVGRGAKRLRYAVRFRACRQTSWPA